MKKKLVLFPVFCLIILVGGCEVVTEQKNIASIEWQGKLSKAPSNPQKNWAYYNITDGKSYIWDEDSWEIIAQDGADGSDSVSSSGYLIVWKGSLGLAPNNPMKGWAYYDTVQKKSFIYDGLSWQQIAQDGADGNDSVSSSGYLIVWKGSLGLAPSNPMKGWAYYDTVQKKSFIYDGSSWQQIAQDGADGSGGSIGGNAEAMGMGLTHIKTTEEIIDGENYRVESYADVISPNGFFYTYYKYYYKGNKLRRFYTYYHTGGNCLNYHYTEFEEHVCSNNNSWNIYTYNESGKPKTQDIYSNGKLILSYTYYENGKIKTQDTYSNGKLSLSYAYTYYENGNKKTENHYPNGELSLSYTYYENGKIKTQDTYSNGKLSLSYTYYENGKKETEERYSSGELSYSERRYSNNECMYVISYNTTDKTINNFYHYYGTGYLESCYISGYLYTYEDGVTTSLSTSSSAYSSKTECTDERAKELIAAFKM